MLIYYSDLFLKHSLNSGHPECKERLETIKKALEKENKLNIKFLEPKPIDDEELYIVHTKEHISKLKQLSEKGDSFSDDNVLSEDNFVDNVFSKDTFKIAKHAAAAARDAALSCKKEFSFALVRPPGHHAGKNFFGGFCYINNVAFAVRSLQKINGFRKIMIIDFDYHTGNGTWDIFYEDPSVFYLSFHCDPHIAYPGTGFEHENTNHMVNVVMNPNTSDREYLEKFEKNVQKYFLSFKPDAIAVSAGFDSYFKDPIAGLEINEIGTYGKIGEMIRSLNKPTFATLEGGYYLPKLGEAANSFISAFQKI